MKLSFDDIIIKKNRLLSAGSIEIVDNGINILTGKNGVGKTLLLKSIFNNYQEMAIYIDQENEEILDNISVTENITMSNDDATISKALKLLNDFDLKYLLDLNVKKLSGGEKRIICILRGLLSDRSLIIMDEPTNDLDYVLVEKFVRIIQKEKKNRTFLIISHDDRLHRGCDTLFNVESCEIHNIIEPKSSEIAINVEKRTFNSKNVVPILNKVFSTNYFIVVIGICISALSFYIIQDLKGTQKTTIPLLQKDQVEIFSPLSSLGTINSGAYPLSIMLLVNENENIFHRAKTIQNKLEEAYKMPITFGLELNDNVNFEIFPLEYYDPTNRSHYYTLDTYLTEVLNLDQNSYYIDTSSKFTETHSDPNGKERYDFNTSSFKKSVDILKNLKNEQGKAPETLFITVKLKNGYSYFDFIGSSELKELANGNYYIKSNETIILTNQVESFNGYKRNISIVLCSGLLFLFLCMLYVVTYSLIVSKKISILKNYGVGKNAIKKVLLKKFNNKKLKLGMFLLIFLTNAISLFYYDMFYQLGNHVVYAIFLTILSIAYWLNKLIISIRINTIYRWYYR